MPLTYSASLAASRIGDESRLRGCRQVDEAVLVKRSVHDGVQLLHVLQIVDEDAVLEAHDHSLNVIPLIRNHFKNESSPPCSLSR